MAINPSCRKYIPSTTNFVLKTFVSFLAFLFLLIYPGMAQEDDSKNYFVHRDESDNFLIFQKLEWNAGSHIKWYEITLEMYDDATDTWLPVNNAIPAVQPTGFLGTTPELVKDGVYKSQHNSITVSLRAKESGEPQKYRYTIAAYNLLGHEAFSTEYTEFEINKAYFPEINRISPELIYLDTLYDASIRVTGENLRHNTDFYLIKNREIIRPIEIIRNDNNRQAELIFDPRTFDTGSWLVQAENPGEFTAHKPLTIKFMKWYDVSLSAGYSPQVVVYDDNFKNYYHANFLPMGIDLRGTFIFLKKRAGYFGVSLNGRWSPVSGESPEYRIQSQLVHSFLAFTYRYPIIRNKLTLEARLGGGLAYTLATKFSFEQDLASEPFSAIYPAATAGLSIAGYAWRGLYIEAGADCIASFSPSMITLSIAPTISIGWTF